MLFEIETSEIFGIDDLHDCEVLDMSLENDVLTLVVSEPGTVEPYHKDQKIAEFHLCKDSWQNVVSVDFVNLGLRLKNNRLTIQEFISLCKNKKYFFEIRHIYCNENLFCIVGYLAKRNTTRSAKVFIEELEVEKVIYR